MPRFTPHGFVRKQLSLGAIAVAAGTGAQAIVTSLPITSRCTIERFDLIPTVAATGGGASRVLNVRRGSGSGTVVATGTLLLADLNAIAVPKGYAANTSGADFVEGDTLSIQIDSGGTSMTAGTFIVVLTFREMPQRVA